MGASCIVVRAGSYTHVSSIERATATRASNVVFEALQQDAQGDSYYEHYQPRLELHSKVATQPKARNITEKAARVAIASRRGISLCPAASVVSL